MPTTISIGSWVTSYVGPFEMVDRQKTGQISISPGKKAKRKRRTRKIARGWVVGPGRAKADTTSTTTWRVLWMNCGKTCDFSGKKLKVVTEKPVSQFNGEIFSQLRECDYFNSAEEFYSYIDSGGFNSQLVLNPPSNPNNNKTYMMPDGKLVLTRTYDFIMYYEYINTNLTHSILPFLIYELIRCIMGWE
jgi:hypothetical protein